MQRLPVHPESHFQCVDTVAVCRYMCVPECTLSNSQVPCGRPSLFYNHTNVILRVVVKDGFYCSQCSGYRSLSRHSMSRHRRTFDVRIRRTKPAIPSALCRIKMLPVVGHVHGLRETLRVRAATANVALTLMKYTHSYII